MKKFFALALVFVLIALCSVSLADLPDISNLTFSELRTLRAACQRAMWDSPEWKKVYIPAGVYKIGKEIPPDKWSIQTKNYNTTYIEYGSKLNGPQTAIDPASVIWSGCLTLDATDYSMPHQIDMLLEVDNYIYFSAEVIFYPYNGKQSFSFE